MMTNNFSKINGKTIWFTVGGWRKKTKIYGNILRRKKMKRKRKTERQRISILFKKVGPFTHIDIHCVISM